MGGRTAAEMCANMRRFCDLIKFYTAARQYNTLNRLTAVRRKWSVSKIAIDAGASTMKFNNLIKIHHGSVLCLVSGPVISSSPT